MEFLRKYEELLELKAGAKWLKRIIDSYEGELEFFRICAMEECKKWMEDNAKDTDSF
jgi:hypothetical protein